MSVGLTEADFLAAIDEIETSLALQQIALPWRPILAHFRFQDRVGHELPYPPPDREAEQGAYDGEDLSIRINRWYGRRYGSQLNEHLGPGRVAFTIHGGRWAMRLPGFVFPARLHIYCGQQPSDLVLDADADHEETINVLNTIEDAPEALGNFISDVEKARLVELFVLAYDALERCSEHADNALIQHALADNDTAVHQLVSRSPSFGAAKWAALQAAEKAIKGFTQVRGGSYRAGHILQNLMPAAEAVGLPAETAKYFPSIQCDAGVRYGDQIVAETEAFDAHHASLAVMRVVGRALEGRVPAI